MCWVVVLLGLLACAHAGDSNEPSAGHIGDLDFQHMTQHLHRQVLAEILHPNLTQAANQTQEETSLEQSNTTAVMQCDEGVNGTLVNCTVSQIPLVNVTDDSLVNQTLPFTNSTHKSIEEQLKENEQRIQELSRLIRFDQTKLHHYRLAEDRLSSPPVTFPPDYAPRPMTSLQPDLEALQPPPQLTTIPVPAIEPELPADNTPPTPHPIGVIPVIQRPPQPLLQPDSAQSLPQDGQSRVTVVDENHPFSGALAVDVTPAPHDFAPSRNMVKLPFEMPQLSEFIDPAFPGTHLHQTEAYTDMNAGDGSSKSSESSRSSQSSQSSTSSSNSSASSGNSSASSGPSSNSSNQGGSSDSSGSSKDSSASSTSMDSSSNSSNSSTNSASSDSSASFTSSSNGGGGGGGGGGSSSGSGDTSSSNPLFSALSSSFASEMQ